MSVLSQAAEEKACSPKRTYTFLEPRPATEPYPPLQFLATAHWQLAPGRWQLATDHWPLPLTGRAVPALPCAGGLPPQRPPEAMPPCVRVSSLPLTPACLRGSRSSNCESRLTTHGRSGPPLCGGTPPATPPCSDAAVRARFQLAADPSVPARLPQFELRLTNHDSRPPRPSLVRGDSPRNAPL